MKNIQVRSSFAIFSFSILVSSLISCSKSNSNGGGSTPLTISSASVSHAAGGATVTLTGTGFTTASNEQVKVNGVAAQVSASNADALSFVVPVKAGTGPITLTVNGQTVNGPQLTYDTTWSLATFAGSTKGDVDGTGTAAQLNTPTGLCFDNAGNLYFAEAAGNRIRMISPAGVVTTIAGSGTKGSADGQGTNATFSAPYAMCIDPAGNLYVLCYGDKTIRKVTATGAVTTMASTATNFSPVQPEGICTDGQGNFFVTDEEAMVVLKVDASGAGSIFAGSSTILVDRDGTGLDATLTYPAGICIDANKNLYVTEVEQNIRKITPAAVVTTVTSFTNLYIAADSLGRLFTSGILSVEEVSGGVKTTLASAGGNGGGLNAPFQGVTAIALDNAGNIYVGDANNSVIYKMTWQ